jgi:effector-binding domain-containing protein
MKQAYAMAWTGSRRPWAKVARLPAWLALLLLAGPAMAVGEPAYRVQESAPPVELREYAAYAVAETRVTGAFADVGNVGFRRLFGYISGENTGSTQIAMTAPVTQQAAPEKIAMTAPVTQQPDADGYRIGFVLPERYTAASAPVPSNPDVRIVDVPARRMIAVRYTGRWTEANYREALGTLLAFAAARGLKLVGEPVYARYDPPIMPSFLRRNEVLVEVAE